MLIDRHMPLGDATEVHSIEIGAMREDVYRALWTADLTASWIIRGLMGLRMLPSLILHPTRVPRAPQRFTLQNLAGAGFGKLEEDPGHEVVFGVTGRFWMPLGNLEPFRIEDFENPVRTGRARAVWNFLVVDAGGGRSTLSTETRILCGDPSSRRKFLTYWFFVRPFSGLIRIVMLRAVRKEFSDTI